MANLMGLLLGASATRLRAMARSWQIDPDAEPQTLVSRLYDEMTDEYAVKSFLDRLSLREKTVLGKVFSSAKGWLSLKELAAILPFGEDETNEILATIQDAGIVAVETVRVVGNEILEGPVFLLRGRPSVQTTIIRIPPDLRRVVYRVRQQMMAGDQSEKSLHKLLGELELPQLLMLCERWSFREGPGGPQRFKKELMLFLEATIGQTSEVNDVLQRLGEQAQLVFRTVRDAHGRVGIETVFHSTGLDDRSLRTAISALASFFLIQETYVEGQRYLFIPTGVGRQHEAPRLQNGALTPLELTEPAHVAGVAGIFFFNLLALLNYFEETQVELIPNERKIPRRVLAELREQLTIGGKDGRGGERLDYLFHVARALGLLETREDRIVASPKVRPWAGRGIIGQAEEVMRLWLADDAWKGLHQAVASLDSSYCQDVRRRIIHCLRKCEPGKWYSFESLIGCVDGECSSGLVAQASPSAQRNPGHGQDALPEDITRSVHHTLAEANLVGTDIAHLFHWMSLCSLSLGETGAISALQLTPLGAWILGCEGAVAPTYCAKSLDVGANFEVKVHEPDTLAWYYLLKFALTVGVGRTSVHQIVKRKVQQAICWGIGDAEFLDMLAERSKNGIPENVAASIEEWAKSVRVVNLEKLIVLEVDTQTVLDDLLASPKYARWFGRRLSPTAIIVRDAPDLKKLMREMRGDGYFPRIDL